MRNLLVLAAAVIGLATIPTVTMAQSETGGPVAGEGPGGSGAGQSSAGPSKAFLKKGVHHRRHRSR